MLFSVVIPTYNRARLLGETLDSVFAQTFKDYEVIVVDDGSTDGTADFVRRLGGRVNFLTQRHRGPGAARNLGARQASGKYLAFLDSDDLWFSWTLDTYAKAVERHGEPSMLVASFVEFSDRCPKFSLGCHEFRAEYFDNYLEAGGREVYVGAGRLVVRAPIFHNGDGFKKDFLCAEEHDLALRLGLAPGFVSVLSPTVLAVRQHTGSASSSIGNTIDGINWIVAQERQNCYPGGTTYAIKRRRIITHVLRPVTLNCLRVGRWRDAWSIYCKSLAWHLREGRWRYLFGFLALALIKAVKSRGRLVK